MRTYMVEESTRGGMVDCFHHRTNVVSSEHAQLRTTSTKKTTLKKKEDLPLARPSSHSVSISFEQLLPLSSLSTLSLSKFFFCSCRGPGTWDVRSVSPKRMTDQQGFFLARMNIQKRVCFAHESQRFSFFRFFCLRNFLRVHKFGLETGKKQTWEQGGTSER